MIPVTRRSVLSIGQERRIRHREPAPTALRGGRVVEEDAVAGTDRARVVVDLTPLAPRPAVGVRLLTLDLLDALARLAPAWKFLLLTTPTNDRTVASVRGRNVRRLCVGGSGEKGTGPLNVKGPVAFSPPRGPAP